MQRLKNYAILSLTIAVLVFPSTASSQIPEFPSEFSPLRTSRSEQSQGQLTPATKFLKSKKPIPNRYIVVLNDGVVSDNAPLEVRRARITAIASRHAQTYCGKFDYIYETALKGYAIELPNEAAAIAISNLKEVKWVEEDALGEFGQAPPFPEPIKATESVCRGKTVVVSLLERPFGLKPSGPRTSYLKGGISQRARLVIRDRDEFNEFWNQLIRVVSDKPRLRAREQAILNQAQPLRQVLPLKNHQRRLTAVRNQDLIALPSQFLDIYSNLTDFGVFL